MYILPEFWNFVVEIYTKDIPEAKRMNQYFIIENIIKYSDNIPIAIPFWTLFQNEEYIDLIIHTFTKNSIVYDSRLKSFVFDQLPSVFLGIQEIYKIINDLFPNDQHIVDNYLIITRVIQTVKDKHNRDNIDDICDLFQRI
jgi:hypothetical protein